MNESNDPISAADEPATGRKTSPVLEMLLQTVLDGVTREGTRFLKVQAKSAAVEAVDVTRKILALHYVVQGLVFLCAGSFLLWTYLLVELGDSVLEISDHRGFWYLVGVWVVVSLGLALSVRRQFWLRWVGLAPGARSSAPPNRRGPTPEELEALVQQTVEKVLAQNR